MREDQKRRKRNEKTRLIGIIFVIIAFIIGVAIAVGKVILFFSALKFLGGIT